MEDVIKLLEICLGRYEYELMRLHDGHTSITIHDEDTVVEIFRADNSEKIKYELQMFLEKEKLI